MTSAVKASEHNYISHIFWERFIIIVVISGEDSGNRISCSNTFALCLVLPFSWK
jgi:hypothetical protein